MRFKTAFFVALFLPSLVQATVFQCGQAGQVAFSDKPCPEGKSTEVAMRGTTGATGTSVFNVVDKTYPVYGSDYAKAFAAMKAMGIYNAWAKWAVTYTFDRKPSDKGCELSYLSVNVNGEILMPDWVEKRNAPSADQRNWQQMWDVLKLHENGHVQNGKEFGVILKERLLGLGVVPCSQLQAKADETYRILYENLRRRDEEYDRRSNHGLRQFNQQ